MKKILFEEDSAPQGSSKQVSRVPQTLGGFGSPVALRWPTDYHVITQDFGANPEIHHHRNLPGHEGLDIRAPVNSKVYACADGIVESIQIHDVKGYPYGRFITIEHKDGYRTTYGHLSTVFVSKGQKVAAGSVIGNAGKTGLTSGGHIHLSLTEQGATSSGLTQFADDVIDPTPFLTFAKNVPDFSFYAWPFSHCLKGLQIPIENGATGLSTYSSAQAVLLGQNIGKETIASLKKGNPTQFLLTQLQLPTTDKPITASEWSNWIKPTIQRHFDSGVGFFSILKSPNLTEQGCGLHWNTGKEFARWWMEAVSILKTSFPIAKFGFPALSPGDQVTGQRLDSQSFMEGVDEAMLSADWLGVICTWSSPQKMLDEGYGKYYAKVRRYFPHHLLFITESGGVGKERDENTKQSEAERYFEHVKNEPGIGAAFSRA